jgi:alkylation response protein AidB-like acyl-CoA dehydrogenase
MHQPGVEVRPLRQITGASHFSEVFLTDARVPHANLLGELHGGWAVTMTTLAAERAFMGGGSSGPGVDDLFALARELGASGDPIVRQGLARAYSRAQIMRYLGMRVRTATSRGLPPGPEASVMKLFAAWNLKGNAELAMQIEGAAGMLAGDDAPDSGRWQQTLLQATALRIAGGSDQVQRNVAGERTLGLPAEPRVDKDVPFRELVRVRGR